jgi:hypothetical protein
VGWQKKEKNSNPEKAAENRLKVELMQHLQGFEILLPDLGECI